MTEPISVVAIGGGHGLARTLEALRHLPVAPTAVVSVADDGGSTGRLRQQFGVVALGDMRKALVALANNTVMSRLLAHRFDQGDVNGHALGNLMMLALLNESDDDLVGILKTLTEATEGVGRVLPCTTEDVTLVAEVDGAEIAGQVAVGTAEGRHQAVWLEPREPAACDDAVAAISTADAVVLGPGSLYTSIVPNLLVPGVTQAIATSSCPIIIVANLHEQPGETGGMGLEEHVDVITQYLPAGREIVLISHTGEVAQAAGKPLTGVVKVEKIASQYTTDLAARRPTGEIMPAHDANRLAAAFAHVLQPLMGEIPPFHPPVDQ